MFTLNSGVVGSAASARAMAAYLSEVQIDAGTMRTAAYYGQTTGTDEAIAAGLSCVPTPRADMAPEVAAALGIDPRTPLDVEAFGRVIAGKRADGEALPGSRPDVRTYKNDAGEDEERHRVAYLDLTLTAPKSLSVAWALAETDAERNSLLQAHRTANAEVMRYIEDQMGWARSGKDGEGELERARIGWVTCDHFTARPTTETVRTNPATGESHTEIKSLNVPGDPLLHSHNIVPNLMVTESGRTVALNTMLFHGRGHEFGAVYDGILGRELQAMGVDATMDPETNKLHLPAVPHDVCDEFSRRTRDAETAAKTLAVKEGVAWETMPDEQRAGFLKFGAHATREHKDTNTPDMEAWRQQAERIGYRHRSVVTHNPPVPLRPRAERMAAADKAGLPHLEDMLSKRAVIGQGDVRLAAARGFMVAGLETTADIGAMMKHWAKGSVVQDGQHTKLIWKEAERGRVKLTTELHRDQERELIGLAQRAVADRRHALAPGLVAAAVAKGPLSYTGEQGRAQRAAVDALGMGGGLGVMIGVAGAGKTKAVVAPLVNAWREQGYEVWGAAQAWRQARDLEGSGIDRFHARALQPFLDGVQDGRTKVNKHSVVVLDELGQIGTRQLLQLLRLREQHGFKVVAIGDDKQCQSIEAGPVVELLRKALGESVIPEILTTVRQHTEEERRIATLFREGKAGEAIAAKREAGTAELVPGGYRNAVERVAQLYAERRQATANQPGYRITISAPTNADAREISRAVREVRREMGEVGPDRATRSAVDGQGVGYTIALAEGDNVRLYARTRAVFKDDAGRAKSASIGDNGTVLRVEAAQADGLMLRGESGKVGFVAWKALQDREGSGRLLLGYGDCLTIDSSQGITSDEHINALPAGSKAVQGFKAYVAESRHRVRSWLVGSMGAEMREVRASRPSGLPSPTPEQAEAAAWANLTKNLENQPLKESALAFLEKAVATTRTKVKSFQKALRTHEARVADGLDATTAKQSVDARQVADALPAIAESLQEIARQRAAVAGTLIALHEYWDSKEARRIDVAARLVGEGDMPFSEALHRVVGAELADRKRGLPIDPLHGLTKTLPGTEDVVTLEQRIEVRLLAAVDAYEARQAATVQAEAPRERQRSGMRA